MDRTRVEEILAALDEMSPWELKELARMLEKRFIGIPPAREIRDRERFEAWRMPWYKQTITGMKATEPSEKALLTRQLRDLLHCELPQAMRIVRSIPCDIEYREGEYPLNCREELRPFMEALEALGFIVEESYHFGEYA